LISQAIPVLGRPNELYWPLQENSSIIACTEGAGVAGIARIFWLFYQATGNETYRDFAIKDTNWLVNSAAILVPGHGFT